MSYSGSRRQVVEVLLQTDRPLTLPEILDADNSQQLAQSSVYRNLTELEGIGVVSRMSIGDNHSRFELHESLTGHHHHLVCTVCGRIEDFDVSEDFESQVEELVFSAEDKGFLVDGHVFDITGRCSTCT
tara:strand:- start:836 stop:1222 length:387 start_codon:yes stop_codon:yes gene_type:complete